MTVPRRFRTLPGTWWDAATSERLTGMAITGNRYVKKRGSKWVVIQRGTGRVLSHHDTKREAEASFRAMEASIRSGSRKGRR